MTTTIPAIQGRFGSTDFYIVTMPASQLEKSLTIPKEMPEWENQTIEERFQREVNYRRVKQQIAPYLASDPDRFFGAFIVDIYNSEGVEFEPLSNVVKSVPRHYQQEVKNFGFLYLTGEEVFVPLDGQHRLAAIKFAISGKDEKGKDIPGISANVDLGADICTCIMIKHDTAKARKIFNKVNRYAKATSKGDNLITADDDIIAVVARENANEFFGDRIVNYKTNTLNRNAIEFTTLSTIYEANSIIVESACGLNKKIDRTMLPPDNEQRLIRESLSAFWTDFTSKLNKILPALHDPDEPGDEKRKQFRQDFVLGKPIVQLAIVETITRLASPNERDERISMDEVYKRLNQANWSVKNDLWQRVLMNGDRVIAGKQARKFAARFLAYYFGEEQQHIEHEQLAAQYAGLFDQSGKELPPPLTSS